MKFSSDVTTLVALFAIVSPITSIPVFLTLTAGASARSRRVTAMQTAAVSGATLLIAYFVGDVILKLLSIQIEAFRTAGALVIRVLSSSPRVLARWSFPWRSHLWRDQVLSQQ
jgi:multiple antibiotic resistance protein